MKYFLDTEFLEGKQDKRFLGIKYGETKPTIDLISIGLVSEDGREYYAISKDFNLWEAWNRYDLEIQSGDMRNHFPEGRKVYWIRENVLKPIFDELVFKYTLIEDKAIQLRTTSGYNPPYKFNYKTFKKLIKLFGKSNKEIAEEILDFTGQYQDTGGLTDLNPKFYAYYADYDWVVFCQLFGKMIDLPNGFPMYCIDLKQEMEESQIENNGVWLIGSKIKTHPDYPKQINEHNALSDARWNKELYEFLNKI